MKLWIDLDNSPHVHFFAPLIPRLADRGVASTITIRSFSQTEELAHWYGLNFRQVGEHFTPHSTLLRVIATLKRALLLATVMRKEKVSAAVSHGSRAMVLAARMLGIPVMTIYDYEFVSSALFHKLSSVVLVPDVVLRNAGLNGHSRNAVGYPGFKEEVYIHDFPMNSGILEELGLNAQKLVVLVRPPADWSHYHHEQSDVLFDALIDRLRQESGVQVLILPRTPAQAREMRMRRGLDEPPFRILDHAVDGLNLMRFADAVFSGGGTMVREAALLGAVAYSTFGGPLGAVDQELAAQGRLRLLRSKEEVAGLCFEKRRERAAENSSFATRNFVLNEICDFVKKVHA